MNGSHSTQRGMVLLLCLIFMTALTLLGLTTSSDSILQRQLASNLRDAEFARQTSLLSLQWAEQWVSQLQVSELTSCQQSCTGFYTHSSGSLDNDMPFQSLANWRLHGYEAGLDPVSGVVLKPIGLNSAEPPVWVIESLHHSPAIVDINTPENSQPEKNWYRILVRGTGRTANSVSVIESVIVRISEDSSQSPPATPHTERLSWRKLR